MVRLRLVEIVAPSAAVVAILALVLAIPVEANGNKVVSTCVSAAASSSNNNGISYIYGAWKNYGSNWTAIDAWNRASLDLIRQSGAQATGASINWCNVQPTQDGGYNWTDIDYQVSTTLARNLTMYAYTGNTPDWALPPAVVKKYGKGIGYRFPPDPSHTDAFTAFFSAVATRYKGKIRHYEFWNEQNGCGWVHDGCANSDPGSIQQYTQWLKLWYKAMKTADPGAVLSVGGLDVNLGVQHGEQYIAGIISAGGGDSFDAVALHPYGSNTDPNNVVHWDVINATHGVLQAAGMGTKEIWVNEYGWNTADEGFKSKAMTAALQGFSSMPFVSATLYLCLTDLPGHPDTGYDGYGIASQDSTTQTLTPRPSLDAFSAFMRRGDAG